MLANVRARWGRWPPWKWVAVALVGAYVTGPAPIVEFSEHCPGFSSPSPAGEHLCHNHLGPDAKSLLRALGSSSAVPADMPAIQNRRLVLRLVNLRLSLFDLDVGTGVYSGPVIETR
ncbi:MAG TPA: hypothetical protein VGS17_04615 [Candidatus Limnocylindria bacterium]|nr:hypothetical protein [Candidatus Limnocylindria bacterium]